jgi:hypothetical protein
MLIPSPDSSESSHPIGWHREKGPIFPAAHPVFLRLHRSEGEGNRHPQDYVKSRTSQISDIACAVAHVVN